MSRLILRNNKFLFRGLDLFILAVTFLAAYDFLQNSILIETSVYTLVSIYAFTAFIFVRLSKKSAKGFLKSSSDILRMACGNAMGLVAAIILFSVLALFIPTFSELLPLAIISSVASFFILGTAVPAFKRILEAKSNQKSFKATI